MARLANNQFSRSSAVAEMYVDEVHAVAEVTAVEAIIVVASLNVAEVLGKNEFAHEVVDLNESVTFGADVEVDVSEIANRVRIDSNAVFAVGFYLRDVKERIIVFVDDVVDSVGDVGAIHEDAAAVGAKIDSIGEFGAAEEVLFSGDTGVTDIFLFLEAIDLLVDSGYRNAVESTNFAPGRAVFSLFESALSGTDKDGAGFSSVSLVGGVNGEDERRVDGNVATLDVLGGNGAGVDVVGVVDVKDVVAFAFTTEGDDDSVFALTWVNRDRGNRTGESESTVSEFDGIETGDTYHTFVVGLIGQLAIGVVHVGSIGSRDVGDAEDVVETEGIVDDSGEESVAILGDSHNGRLVAVGATIEVEPVHGAVEVASVGGGPNFGIVGRSHGHVDDAKTFTILTVDEEAASDGVVGGDGEDRVVGVG